MESRNCLCQTTAQIITILAALSVLAGPSARGATSQSLFDPDGYLYDVVTVPSTRFANGSDDAYDGAYVLMIDGVRYNAKDLSLQGRNIIGTVETLSNLQVARKLYVPASKDGALGNFGRWYDSLHNPTGLAITVSIEYQSNLGSDSGTRVTNTSDGNTIVETQDEWIATDDYSDGGGDPSLAHVMYGKGGSEVIDDVQLYSYDDLDWRYDNVVVPPGQTIVFLTFAVQETDQASSWEEAEGILDSVNTYGLDGTALKGLSRSEYGQIVNFPIHIYDLSVEPRDDFVSDGDEGVWPESFEPISKDYTLENVGPASIDWAVEPNVTWLKVDPSEGTLFPGESTLVTVSINELANNLDPNYLDPDPKPYTGKIIFHNLTSGLDQTRDVTLNLWRGKGKIEVTDSIGDPNDRKLSFGDVVEGLSRIEQVTITNTDPNHELYVTDISLVGRFEDFYDDFPSTTLNPENWTNTSEYPGIDSVGDGEPSPPYSLRMNSQDTIESRELDISMSGELQLSYWYERTGGGEDPDTDDDLIFEYDLDPDPESETWVELDRQYGSGWDMTSYEQVFVLLPSSAYHTGFRLRIRTDCDSTYDDWFVDDVSITAASNGGLFASQGFRLENIPDLNEPIPPLSSILFDVNFTPTDYADYESTLVIASDDKDEPNIVLQLSGSAIKDYLKIIPDVNIVTEFSGHPGGPFLPSSTSYRLTNVGPNDIDWIVEPNVLWLSIDPNIGTLQPGDSNSIKVTIRPNAEVGTLLKGKYCGDLVFTDLTTTIEQARKVCLDVYTRSKVWISPYSFDVTISRGDCLTEILTIGNRGDSPLNFGISAYGDGGGTPPPPRRRSMFAAAHKAKEAASLSPREVDFTSLDESSYVEGELLVRFAPKPDRNLLSSAEKNTILSAVGGIIEKEYDIVSGLCLIKLPSGVTVKQSLLSLNNTDEILYAEPNYKRKALSTIPDDPGFIDELWGMVKISAPEAWDISTGSQDIIVAVIDTGVDYTHDDLVSNIWINSVEDHEPFGEIGQEDFDGRDDDDNGRVDDIYGFDYYNNDSNPDDDDSHGTHCAGTIGAVGDNSEGIAGVCWNVKIMALKSLNSEGKGDVGEEIDCIHYAIDMGAKVTNNSYGSYEYSQAEKDAIAAANEAGVIFVAAAGNPFSWEDPNNETNPHYPSSYDCDNIIAVMATDEDDKRSIWSLNESAYGPDSVDLGAPGTDIWSCVLDDGYDYKNGTSMAAPHVAGACALVWSVCPSLSHLEVKDIIMRTVDPVDDLQGKCVSGGRLNLHKALLAALEQAESTTGWLEVEPSAGDIPPGGVVDVNVTFCADPPPGTYSNQITIDSNDPHRPTIKIPVTMTVVPVDYFTELFDLGDPFHPYSLSSPNSFSDPNRNDMVYRTLTFVPEDGSASHYKACCSEAVAFPVDPNGGTEISLRDDDYIEVNLIGGKDVNFYGIEYETCYIGSNGYITFEAPDIRHHESLTDHFELPRISALFDDLDPSAGGTISWKQLNDRVVLTFENVPELGTSNGNSFQIEIFFNGTIRITWLDIAAPDGLVGLSEGIGLTPYFVESDLSEYNLQGVLDSDCHIGFADYAKLAAYWSAADCKADNNWCFGTDIDKDGRVAFNDLAELSVHWLECIGAECD